MDDSIDFLKSNAGDIIPPFENFSQSREEYIKALEMSVQLLQREVEHLRNKLGEIEKPFETSTLAEYMDKFDKTASLFNSCSGTKEVLSKLYEELFQRFSLLECNIYFFSSERSLIPVSDAETSITLNNHIRSFEEEGIIDWAAEKQQASVIPNLTESEEDSPTSFILLPLSLKGVIIGIFAARTTAVPGSFTREDYDMLTIIAAYASIALDNIRSSEEIERMNKRLTVLNSQMLQSSRLASIGELASSIMSGMETPLQVMNGHLNLLESGVGDSRRRIQIIKEQIQKIKDITDRLGNFAVLPTGERTSTTFNVCSLIDEVLLLSDSQLQRDAIRVEKEYEDSTCIISAYKPQLEQVIMNLLLNARDSMPDGGSLTIGVFRLSRERIMISIADTGEGIAEKDLPFVFDPYYDSNVVNKRMGMGLSLIRSIIQQHGGSIGVFSEPGKGTTFKIVMPVAK